MLKEGAKEKLRLKEQEYLAWEARHHPTPDHVKQ
jgi:hypothetical protein